MRHGYRQHFSRAGAFQSAAGLDDSRAGSRDVVNEDYIFPADTSGIRPKTSGEIVQAFFLFTDHGLARRLPNFCQSFIVYVNWSVGAFENGLR